MAPLFSGTASGQDARGRKYKAPPATAHFVVEVTKASNGKPIVNASVVFHPIKDGKDEGNLEIKSDPDGKATIDVIPIGSQVTVQVFADGFATFAQDYTLTDPEKDIHVKLLRPRAQVSTYVDNDGKACADSARCAGAASAGARAAVLHDSRSPSECELLGSAQHQPAVGVHEQIDGREDCAGHRRGQAHRSRDRAGLAPSWARMSRSPIGASADEAEETVRELAGLDVEAMAVRCDLRDPENIREAVARWSRSSGGWISWSTTPGSSSRRRSKRSRSSSGTACSTTNTRGPFLVAQAAYPHLKAARGRIINIGSLGGIHPWATHAHYCTSKAALHMLSQTMAKAWAPEISVNCVAPGMIVQGEVGAGLRALRASARR